MADVAMWVKFKVNMYEDTKLKIIDSEDKRDLYHYVWARSIVLAGKINLGGYLYITDKMPHTIKTLAIEFNRSVEEVKDAFKILRKLEMIELTKDKVFKIKNWEKHQNVEGMERAKQLNVNRVAKCRAKKKAANDSCESDIKSDSSASDGVKIAVDEAANKKDIHVDENSSNIIEDQSSEDIETNNKNFLDESGNVTCNDENSNCNATVMKQNKKEIKKKNKKKEIENKSKNSVDDINNKSSSCNEEVNQSNTFENNNTKSESPKDDINIKAMELMQYHQKITGQLGGCDYFALASAIDIYGEKWVKMAMDVGFQKNCPDINYAIGVLKNWKRDGCPEEQMEVKKNGLRSIGKNIAADKNEFAGFKPKEPRKLTEAERKRIQANLI